MAQPGRRRREIIDHVAAGLGSTQIAEVMGIRRNSVRTELWRMYREYRVRNAPALVALAFRAGWIE